MDTDFPITLPQVAHRIQDGDLFLLRGKGLISIAGRSLYCHAAMAVLIRKKLFLAEMVCAGGRLVTLESQIAQNPGRYDWYALDSNRFADFDRQASADYMCGLASGRYGWLALAKAFWLHCPLVRCFVAPDLDDKTITRYPPFCSQAISRAAVHGGGVDPVHLLSNRLTEPGDLARSSLWKYQGTVA